MINFDHNATAPLLPLAGDAWLKAAEQFAGNPSSPHRLGGRAEAALNDARQRLAALLGCDALDIVWTSGATESNNMVLHHAAVLAGPEDSIWISAIEHPSVLEPARTWFPRRVVSIPVTRSGRADPDWLESKLRTKKRPALIGLMAANNETGVLQPWRETLARCRQEGIPFFCDATQWIGKLPGAGLGQADFLSGSAHKFGGPKGIGFLKCPSRGKFEPLLFGGKQEEARRAGTENVPGAIALVAALAHRESALCAPLPPKKNPGQTAKPGVESAELSLRLAWREQFERRLLGEVDGAAIVGTQTSRLWNTVSVLMPKKFSQHRWVVKLDKLGFAVSTGSACASGREELSHVLRAMGYDQDDAGRVLRFSSGWETTESDWNALLTAILQLQNG